MTYHNWPKSKHNRRWRRMMGRRLRKLYERVDAILLWRESRLQVMKEMQCCVLQEMVDKIADDMGLEQRPVVRLE
jgi:hypothetical protein